MNCKKLCAFFLLLAFCIGCFTACGGQEPSVEPTSVTETEAVLQVIDHAGSLTLDMSSETAKQEVTVRSFVDGDTVHFHVPAEVMASGILKARFLAINTPESTGKIEEFGKKASEFTKQILSNATSIILESESSSWIPDSTGDRYLVWVWYKTADDENYRNLNIEILQNGLAIANSTASSRYGSVAMEALNQAKAQKLHIYSGQPDPDFYYGEAIELTLKELRINAQSYTGRKVAFHGVVTSNSGTQGVYVESYDTETDMHYGMYIYYGHGLNGTGLDILSVGNEVRIVGTVQYYEAGGTYQVSDLNYRMMKPDDPGNIQKLGEGFTPAYRLTEADTFVNGQMTVDRGGEQVTVPYASVALATSLELRSLKVAEVITTTAEDSSSKGAMTLLCDAGGIPVTVRTAVLLDENGQKITAEAYLGKTIDVKGFVDFFDGTYQIKVYTPNNITVID